MTMCVALLCLLLLVHTSNAFAPKRPFATRTRGFPRLWELKEDHDPNPSPFSEYMMQRGVMGPSDNAALGEAMKEESGKDQPSSFVMQNGTKGPSENATSQEVTLEETVKGGLEPASLTANESHADVLTEETSHHVHEMTSVIEVNDLQVALEDNSAVTIAGEVELAKTVLLGNDPVDVEDKQDADNTNSVVAKAEVELVIDAITLPESAVVDTGTNVEVDSDQDLLASAAVAKDAPEVSFDSVQLEGESSPIVEAKDTLADDSFDSAREKVTLEEVLKLSSESKDKREVETAPATKMVGMPGDALKPKDKSDDVKTAAIGSLEEAPGLSFDTTRIELESDSIIETKGTLEEDLLVDSKYKAEVQTEPTVKVIPEDILNIPLKSKDGSDDVTAPVIGTLEDSADFPFDSTRDEYESDPVIETKGTMEEDLLVDSRYEAGVHTEPTVDMMTEDILDIPLRTEDGSDVGIAPVIGTLEVSPDFPYSTRDELESDPVIETNGTLEEDLLVDSKYKAEVHTEPTVDLMPEDIPDIPLKTKDGSDDVIATAIGTLEGSPDSPFDFIRDELESDRVIESKGTLEEDFLVHTRYKAEVHTGLTVDMMPEDFLDIPLEFKDESENETTVLIEKVDTTEATKPVVVIENEVDRLKESAVFKEETREKAGFFFGTTLDESTVLRRIKERKEERKESKANRRKEELSLLEQLQTAKDELDEVKRQSDLDMRELRAEARRRQAEWRERLNDMIAKVEIAEDLNARTQSKMQEMITSRFEYEVDAKEWKGRYARDSPLWTDRYEREREYRRQEQIAARERLSKTQAEYREIVRLAKEEGRQKTAEIKLEMFNQLGQKEMRLRENDVRLKQLQNAVEANNTRIAELERERTSVRELVREAWVIVKGRLQKRSAIIKGRLQKRWAKRKAEETSEK